MSFRNFMNFFSMEMYFRLLIFFTIPSIVVISYISVLKKQNKNMHHDVIKESSYLTLFFLIFRIVERVQTIPSR